MSDRSGTGDADQRVALWMISKGYATGHGDTVEDMLGELEAQAIQRGKVAMGKWQPIETAPKDGSLILTYRPNAAREGRPPVTTDWYEESNEGWQRSNRRFYPPTLWQPLPEPPRRRAS